MRDKIIVDKMLRYANKVCEYCKGVSYEDFRANDTYSMRQAIEEHFIFDVLENYTTYETYFHLGKATKENPEYAKKQANKALGKYMSLHPHNLRQKTEIIVEHFRSHVMGQIGGRAKAMIVTGSRLHALR